MSAYSRQINVVVLVVTIITSSQLWFSLKVSATPARWQSSGESLTPLQREIEKQRQRLSSGETEERRDALLRLRSLGDPAAARAAAAALTDPAPLVRATAAASVLALPPAESVADLTPLLNDKDEFVRQQTAYALGQTRSTSAVSSLVERLTDKQDSVRGAAAVALGEIGDATAVTPLGFLLNQAGALGQLKKLSKSKPEKNVFVLRAAAHSLGQIGNRAALPVLLVVLRDEKAENDVRREVAVALGAIGDPSAIPALQEVLVADDPYLTEAAYQAIRKISKAGVRS